MEINRTLAEHTLREHSGDIVEALITLTNWYLYIWLKLKLSFKFLCKICNPILQQMSGTNFYWYISHVYKITYIIITYSCFSLISVSKYKLINSYTDIENAFINVNTNVNAILIVHGMSSWLSIWGNTCSKPLIMFIRDSRIDKIERWI